MAIFQNIFKREAGHVPVSASQRASITVKGVPQLVQAESQALTVPAFFRALELRARTMSMLPMQYQILKKAGGNYEMDLGTDRGKRMNYLLSVQPNERMNWPTLMATAEIMRVIHGNAYLYVERSGLDVVAIWLCQSVAYNSYENTYNVYYNIGGGAVAQEDNVPARDVIHIKNTFSHDGGMTGIGTLAYARRCLSIAATNDQLTLDVAGKGGNIKMAVREDKEQSFGVGKVQSSQIKKEAERLNDDWYASDFIFVQNAADLVNYSQSMQDLQVLDQRKFSVAEIARLMGVPSHLLGDTTNSNYKTADAATVDFLQWSIGPVIREWECEFNAKLLGSALYGTHRYHMCEKPLFRLDLSGQATWNKSRLETGIASVNELRAEQDLPTIKGGDDHYVSTSLAVVGSEKLTTQKGGQNASADK